jgi:Mg2+-importing ATPase
LCAGVDEDAIAGPMRWDGKFGEALFRTGRFMESITTQVQVVFVIRTRRPTFRSRLCVLLAVMARFETNGPVSPATRLRQPD